MSVCLVVCLSVYLSVYLSVCLSVWLSVCLSICLSICLSVWLSVYLSVCLSGCLSVWLSVWLSVYLCLSVCLVVCLSGCLCLSVCPPSFYQHLCEAVASLSATVGSDGEALTPQTLSGLTANPVKLQNSLSSDIAEENAATCIMKTSSVKHAARIRSCQGRGAGLWLRTIPSAPKFVIKSSEFRLTAFLRLGIPLPFSNCYQV